VTDFQALNLAKIARTNPSVDLEILEKALREAQENKIRPKSRTNLRKLPYISTIGQDGSWFDI